MKRPLPSVTVNVRLTSFTRLRIVVSKGVSPDWPRACAAHNKTTTVAAPPRRHSRNFIALTSRSFSAEPLWRFTSADDGATHVQEVTKSRPLRASDYVGTEV